MKQMEVGWSRHTVNRLAKALFQHSTVADQDRLHAAVDVSIEIANGSILAHCTLHGCDCEALIKKRCISHTCKTSLQQHSFSPLAGLLLLLLTSLLGVHGSEQMPVLTIDKVSLAQASCTGRFSCPYHSICLLSWSVSKHKLLSDATGITIRHAW